MERKPAYGIEWAPCSFHNHTCFIIWINAKEILCRIKGSFDPAEPSQVYQTGPVSHVGEWGGRGAGDEGHGGVAGGAQLVLHHRPAVW